MGTSMLFGAGVGERNLTGSSHVVADEKLVADEETQVNGKGGQRGRSRLHVLPYSVRGTGRRMAEYAATGRSVRQD